MERRATGASCSTGWATRPQSDMAARSQAGGVAGHFTAWVSWNGATEVVAWRVNGGPSTTTLSPLATAAKIGFETTIDFIGDGALVLRRRRPRCQRERSRPHPAGNDQLSAALLLAFGHVRAPLNTIGGPLSFPVLLAGESLALRLQSHQGLIDAPNLQELLLSRKVPLSDADVDAISNAHSLRGFDWFGEDVPVRAWKPVVERVGLLPFP